MTSEEYSSLITTLFGVVSFICKTAITIVLMLVIPYWIESLRPSLLYVLPFNSQYHTRLKNSCHNSIMLTRVPKLCGCIPFLYVCSPHLVFVSMPPTLGCWSSFAVTSYPFFLSFLNFELWDVWHSWGCYSSLCRSFFFLDSELKVFGSLAVSAFNRSSICCFLPILLPVLS